MHTDRKKSIQESQVAVKVLRPALNRIFICLLLGFLCGFQIQFDRLNEYSSALIFLANSITNDGHFPCNFPVFQMPPWTLVSDASRRSRLEQILTKSLKKEAQKISPVKCTIPNSIRAKNPRRGLLGLRIFSANLQRENGDYFSVSISCTLFENYSKCRI